MSTISIRRDGAFAAFQQELALFTWAPLQPAADAFASDMMMVLAEEAHKILSALHEENAEGLVYGTMRLFLELTRVLAVQQGTLITSNSTYLRQVEERVGRDSAWTGVHRVAGGLDESPTTGKPLWARAVAGLRLYVESAALLRSILLPAHRDVIENAARVIREALPAGPAARTE